MESDSLRYLRERKGKLQADLAALRQQIIPIERELTQVEIGIRAMTNDLIRPTGLQATRAAVIHFARKSNPEAAHLTIKELVKKALAEHLKDGATAAQLLDFFSRQWGRTDIARTSLSPQLSRLREDGQIWLDGKTWHLNRDDFHDLLAVEVSKEIEPPAESRSGPIVAESDGTNVAKGLDQPIPSVGEQD